MPRKCSIKTFCISPEGRVLTVSHEQDRLLHEPNSDVVISKFAGKTIKFASFVIDVENGELGHIDKAYYLLFRFFDDGRLDWKRYQNDTHALMHAGWEKIFPTKKNESNVIDMSNQFQANGSRWIPTQDELNLLSNAIYGDIRLSRLRLDSQLSKKA